MNITRHFLIAGIAAPIFYFIIILGFGFLYPNFNHITNMGSDLGANDAPYVYASAFNACLMLSGVAFIAGALGIFSRLKQNGANMALASLTSITLLSFGFSYIMFGYYPLPLEIHGMWAFPMFLGILTPLFGALALRRFSNQDKARKIIMLGFAVNFILAFFVFDFLDLQVIGDDYFGLWVRGWAIVLFATLGYLSWTIRLLNDTDTAMASHPTSRSER